MRQVEDSDFRGKTVKDVICSSVNHIHLTFTDGTELDLWAEQAVNTVGGPIPGIFVDE